MLGINAHLLVFTLYVSDFNSSIKILQDHIIICALMIICLQVIFISGKSKYRLNVIEWEKAFQGIRYIYTICQVRLQIQF